MSTVADEGQRWAAYHAAGDRNVTGMFPHEIMIAAYMSMEFSDDEESIDDDHSMTSLVLSKGEQTAVVWMENGHDCPEQIAALTVLVDDGAVPLGVMQVRAEDECPTDLDVLEVHAFAGIDELELYARARGIMRAGRVETAAYYATDWQQLLERQSA
jgi:hypothetical protein